MSGLYERARSAAGRYARRLMPYRRTPRSAPDLGTLLRVWGVADVRRVRYLGGTTGGRWRVDAQDASYVLREIVVVREYLEYELMLIEHLGTADFPYDIPRIVRTAASSLYHSDAHRHWVLQRFVAGTRSPEPSTPDRARSLGTLVARYHRAVAGFDVGSAGRFRLPLFDTERTIATLAHALASTHLSRGRGVLRTATETARLPSVLSSIPASAVQTVRRLPTIAAYNDWHRYNVVSRAGTIAGLIDYDSIVEAPRIVDVQNALTYVLVGKKHPDLRLASAFLDGYTGAASLSPEEAALVFPVMLDRVAWLITDILDEIGRVGESAREGLALALARLLSWLTAHEEEWRHLLPARA